MKFYPTILFALALSSAALAQTTHADWPKSLSMGMIPTDGEAETLKGFKSLEEYLSKKLGVPVTMKVGKDYASVTSDMGKGDLNFAYFGPASYISAAATAGAETLVKENAVTSGTGYNSLIVSKVGSKLETLADLKGKSFALVDTKSTSGYLVPMVYFMQKLKIKPESYFRSITFSESHDNSIQAVFRGRVDAAAVSSLELQKSIAQGQVKQADFNILWRSDPIPSATIAVHKLLPTSLKTALKEALLEYLGETLKYLKLVNFVTSQDSDYDGVRELETFRKQLQK